MLHNVQKRFCIYIYLYADGKQLWSGPWWWRWNCCRWYRDLRAPCWLLRPPPPALPPPPTIPPATHSIGWNLCTGVTMGFARDRRRCLLCCCPQPAADNEAGTRWRPLKPHAWLRLSIQKCMEDLASSWDCGSWTLNNHRYCHHKPENKKLFVRAFEAYFFQPVWPGTACSLSQQVMSADLMSLPYTPWVRRQLLWLPFGIWSLAFYVGHSIRLEGYIHMLCPHKLCIYTLLFLFQPDDGLAGWNMFLRE